MVEHRLDEAFQVLGHPTRRAMRAGIVERSVGGRTRVCRLAPEPIFDALTVIEAMRVRGTEQANRGSTPLHRTRQVAAPVNADVRRPHECDDFTYHERP